MSTTTSGQILKLKSEIQRLEKQIAINGGDQVETERLRRMIATRRDLLKQLGV